MDTVLALVAQMGHRQDIDLRDFERSPLCIKLKEHMDKKVKLTFILPAFPAKSSNRNKTHGPLPDMGEVLALKRLQELCLKIEKHYTPGAEIIICSDGRVFNDLVEVSDQDLARYSQCIHEILRDFKLDRLKTYSLEEFYPSQARERLLQEFAPALEEIKELITKNENDLKMFNGIHRFIKDDLAFKAHFLSKNQLHRQSKEIAYQVIQRSRAWDNLLSAVFPDTLRLSIHPYPLEHHKFGIELVKAQDQWGTPWHNVALKVSDSFKLVKRIEALRLGARVQHFAGKYAYYEI